MDPYWWWWPSIFLAVGVCLWITVKAGVFDEIPDDPEEEPEPAVEDPDDQPRLWSRG